MISVEKGQSRNRKCFAFASISYFKLQILLMGAQKYFSLLRKPL